MIRLITGLPGHGKSLLAVNVITQALQYGTPVASNVDLVEGWERRIANRDPVYWVRPLRRRRWLREARSRFHYSSEREDLFAIRLHGRGEGRGLMLLDEGAQWLNARAWKAGDREAVVEFFSEHRKLGWNIILVAQFAEQLDRQVRDLVEEHTAVRNLRKTARAAGIPLVPMNLFFAITVWPGQKRIVLKRQFFRVNWRRRLYDTHATVEGWAEEAEQRGLWLPSAPESRTETTGDGRTDALAAARPAPAVDGREAAAEDASEAGEPESWEQERDLSEKGLP